MVDGTAARLDRVRRIGGFPANRPAKKGRLWGHGPALLRADANDCFGSEHCRSASDPANGRLRRILLVAASSGGGLLTERRTAARPSRRELALMPVGGPRSEAGALG